MQNCSHTYIIIEYLLVLFHSMVAVIHRSWSLAINVKMYRSDEYLSANNQSTFVHN